MLIGYIRVSTADQNTELQEDALKKEKCNKIFKDVASGEKSDRVGLDKALQFARKGDTLVVWKLDRLGRSLKLLMGHSSVTTTEVYSNMNLKRVAQDFPTIVTSYVNEPKIGESYTEKSYTMAIPMPYVS